MTILPVAVALAIGAIAVVVMFVSEPVVTPDPGLVTFTEAIWPLLLATPTTVGATPANPPAMVTVRGTSDPLTKPLPIGVGKITA